jgi:hypothetical protein
MVPGRCTLSSSTTSPVRDAKAPMLHLATARNSTATHHESRLDILEKILKPRTLGDFADSTALVPADAGNHDPRRA